MGEVNPDVRIILDALAENWEKMQRYGYDAIAVNSIVCLPIMPSWLDAPAGARYCVTNANQLQYWTDELPDLQYGYTGFQQTGAMMDFYREVQLPLGLDWRLCIWKIPDEWIHRHDVEVGG